MHNLRPLGLLIRIKSEDGGDGLTPVSALGLSIEQPD